MKLEYYKVNDYYVPNIKGPTNDESYVAGKYGRLIEKYLREFKPATFDRLLMEGKLQNYIMQLEKEAKEYEKTLIAQFVKAENVNEDLKSKDQIKWVQEMNNIKNRAEEIVLKEIIYK